ncbi:MAG: hypothetical protein K9W44_10035 [Candidatus Lokiarchaeota archaeon]|nr:hypothetical protein [Candidatus Harpocratesius repetitus]
MSTPKKEREKEQSKEETTGQFIKPKLELPLYAQHTNGCGLASLLMLINVPKNPSIKKFLDKIWSYIKPLYNNPPVVKPELQWAIVLQYILLKIVGYADKEDLYAFFNQRLEFMYEDQRIMNKFNQEQYYNTLLRKKKLLEAYTFLHYTEDHDYITPLLLYKNLHTMKTDLELKILAELFNYQFLYQDAEDYTGAIYFTSQELGREISQSARVKWNRLEKFSQHPDIIILYGQQHHWLAVRGFYKIQAKDNIPEEVVEEIRYKKQNRNHIKYIENVKENSQNQEKQEKKENREILVTSTTSSISSKSLNASTSQTIKNNKSNENINSNEKYNSILAEISAIFEDEFTIWHPRRLIVDLHDPALVSRVKIPYKGLNESDRFYIFKKRPIKDYPAFSLILKYIKDDSLAEQVRWKDYLEKRAKSMKSN